MVGYIDEGVMWKISVSTRVQILTQSSAQENILCNWVNCSGSIYFTVKHQTSRGWRAILFIIAKGVTDEFVLAH